MVADPRASNPPSLLPRRGQQAGLLVCCAVAAVVGTLLPPKAGVQARFLLQLMFVAVFVFYRKQNPISIVSSACSGVDPHSPNDGKILGAITSCRILSCFRIIRPVALSAPLASADTTLPFVEMRSVSPDVFGAPSECSARSSGRWRAALLFREHLTLLRSCSNRLHWDGIPPVRRF